KLETAVKAHSGHVPVPIAIVEKPGAEPEQVADGAALWVKPRTEIMPEEYTDFYRSVAGQFDEPALAVRYRAGGGREYTVVAGVARARRCGGKTRIQGAGFRAWSQAVRSLRSRPRRAHQALCEARVHHR